MIKIYARESLSGWYQISSFLSFIVTVSPGATAVTANSILSALVAHKKCNFGFILYTAGKQLVTSRMFCAESTLNS